jgi:hypothetical protein
MAAYNACEKIGMPECDTILAHLVVHLAETKKSVRSYKAYNLVKSTIRNEPGYPVPMHIRNAPTKLMKVNNTKDCFLLYWFFFFKIHFIYNRTWVMVKITSTIQIMMSLWIKLIFLTS